MPSIERFDPTKFNPRHYILQSGPGERRARSFLVLNSLMTKAVVESLDVIRNMPASERSRILLSGEDPVLMVPEHETVYSRRIHGVGNVDDEGYLQIDKFYRSVTHNIVGVDGFESPVGQYKLRLAYAVVQAARAVSALIDHVKQTHPQIMEAHPDYNLALQITFQKNIRGALVEGVQTLAGQFGLLAISKVPEFKSDPMALFDALLRDGTLNAWAAHAQFGRTAPQFSGAQEAVAVPLQIVEGSDGQGKKTRLTDEAKDNLLEDPDNVNARRDGCPVARKNTPVERNGQREVIAESGINLLAGLYGLYLKHYYNAQHNEEERQRLDALEVFVPVIDF